MLPSWLLGHTFVHKPLPRKEEAKNWESHLPEKQNKIKVVLLVHSTQQPYRCLGVSPSRKALAYHITSGYLSTFERHIHNCTSGNRLKLPQDASAEHLLPAVRRPDRRRRGSGACHRSMKTPVPLSVPRANQVHRSWAMPPWSSPTLPASSTRQLCPLRPTSSLPTRTVEMSRAPSLPSAPRTALA